jgi:hypothetical protein
MSPVSSNCKRAYEHAACFCALLVFAVQGYLCLHYCADDCELLSKLESCHCAFKFFFSRLWI